MLIAVTKALYLNFKRAYKKETNLNLSLEVHKVVWDTNFASLSLCYSLRICLPLYNS